jgi:hypothetical protein
MWQALETKARFIAQVMTVESAVRRAEDIGGQELSYAEVKAIASGNPAVLTLAEADAELQRLALLKKNHLDEQFVARRRVRDLPGTIASLSERLSNLTTDQATATGRANDPITIGRRAYAREDATGALGSELDTLPRHVHETRRVPLGIYRGLRFGLVLHPHCAPDVYLEGAATRQAGYLREHQGPRAVLNAIERLVNAYDTDCTRVRQDRAIAESQLRDYQARLGQPFPHDAYLSELTLLRDQLKAGLSATAQAKGDEAKSTVAELAERIKSLKAVHTIEATPQRGRPKASSAEEPVTARIRRHTQSTPASDPTNDSDASALPPGESPLSEATIQATLGNHTPSGTLPDPSASRKSPIKPAMTFQERVARNRRRDEGPEMGL